MPQYPFAPVSTDLGAVITLAAAGAGTVNSANINNSVASGIQVRLYVSAATGTTPTVLLTVQGYDPASGQYYPIAATSALAAAATDFYVLTVYPTTLAASGGNATTVEAAIPPVYRVEATIAGTTPAVTGTISVCTLV